MGEYADMHAAIMNMDPPEGPSDFGDRFDEELDAAYKRGFRDARHAAAELARAALSAPAVPPSVIAVAREFVNNEYRGPLHQARLVFDCIAALPAAPSTKEPQT